MSPVRAEDRRRYPPDWPDISDRIRFGRAGGRCECEGECDATGPLRHTGRCHAVHGTLHPDTGKRVVLTTAHRNHTPEDCRDDNLFAACQPCHLNYDREHHAETRARTAREVAAQGADALF